jgi:hypothetical protein
MRTLLMLLFYGFLSVLYGLVCLAPQTALVIEEAVRRYFRPRLRFPETSGKITRWT